MKSPSIYLVYPGNCEEAFDFYAETLGGHISMKSRYRDMPANPDFPPIPKTHQDLVMHITLDLVDGSIIQGSDRVSGFGPTLEVGNNFSVSIQTDGSQDADRIHHALAENGIVTMPMQKTFWGAYFGSCQDRFGVNWMIAFNAGQNQS